MKINKKYFDKFQINKSNSYLITFVSIILLVIYIILICYDDNIAVQVMKGLKTEEIELKLEIIKVLKNLLLIIISVFLTSVLSSYLIDIKTKNNIYSDLLINDIFASPDFFNNLNEYNKKHMLNNLERNIYFNGSKEKEKMYKSIRKKLNINMKDNCYYDYCKYDIKCTVFSEYIEKQIVKTIRIRTFSEEKEQIKKFSFLQSASGKIDGQNSVDLVSVEMDGKTINLESEIECVEKPIEVFNQKGGYYNNIAYQYKKDMNIRNETYTEIKIEYITRVERTDLTYTCRLRHPCKKFIFEYSLNGEGVEKNRLNTFAFGFIDDASKTPNHTYNNKVVNVEFNDWAFPHDGVAIVIYEK